MVTAVASIVVALLFGTVNMMMASMMIQFFGTPLGSAVMVHELTSARSWYVALFEVCFVLFSWL